MRPLAEGGLGEVLVANDQELNRDVALKQIRPQLADDLRARQRFLLEAEITGSLEHPGIVPVYGLGTYQDGRPYYAMRLIRGESLRAASESYHKRFAEDRHSTEKTLALRKLLNRFVDICQTIEYAHSRGVLHRDIKPDNVMLGPYGETLVVDWGLAKAAGLADEAAEDHADGTYEPTLRPSAGSGTAPTRMGSVIGTPAFMSPEQAAGQIDAMGPASDIYSLGATLYFIICGKTALESSDRASREDVSAFLQRVARGDYPAAHQLNPSVPRPLSAICSRAMAALPEDRYQSAQDLADDVSRFLADEPVLAYPDPPAVRLKRWVRRHQAIASTTAALVLASTLGLIIFLTILQGKQRQLEETNDRLEVARATAVEAAEEAERGRQAADLAKGNELAFSRFLVNNILATARPLGQAGGLGIDIKVVDALLAAEEEIDTAFAERPLAEATARSGLGDTWQMLGDYPRAIQHYRRSSELLQQELGENHLEAVASLSSLALALKANGELSQAITLQEQTLRDLQQLVGSADSKTLIAKNNLGLSYLDAGDYPRAIAMLEEALQETQDLFGPDTPQTLNSLDNLAAALRFGDQQQRSRALELYEQVIPKKRQVLGETHPETLSAVNNLATMLLDQGDSETAIRMLEELVERMSELLGADHATTLVTQTNLAFAYARADAYEAAITLLEETIELSSEQLSLDHPSTLNAIDILAVILDDLGELDQAIKFYEQAAAGRERVLGANNPETLTTKSNLALAYLANGQSARAIEIAEPILAYRRRVLTDDHPLVTLSLNNLAAAYAEHGDLTEARQLYGELADLLSDAEDRSEYWRVRNNLADLCLRAGDSPAAIEIYQQQLAELRAAPESYAFFRSLTAQNLAVTLVKIGDFAPAQKLLGDLINQQRDKIAAAEDPAARSMLRSLLVYLTECHLGQQDYVAAERAASEAVAIASELLPGDWRLFNAQSQLGECLLGQAKLEEAATILETAHQQLLDQQQMIPPSMRTDILNASFDRLIQLAAARQQPAVAEQLRQQREQTLSGEEALGTSEP